MNKASILLPGDGKWEGYRNIKKNTGLTEQLEQMWNMYEPYADKAFRTELKENKDKFNQRVWELYLGYRLLKSNHELIQSKNKSKGGPDMSVLVNNTKVWIENVCPAVGSDKNNSIPDPKPIDDCSSPESGVGPKMLPLQYEKAERQTKLRYLSVIKDKKDILISYVDKKIINKNEPIIIALNSANNIYERYPSPFTPLIVKICYGLGKERIKVQLDKRKVELLDYESEQYIKKIKVEGDDLNIPTNIFCTDEYKNVSAILFSYYSIECYSINHESEYLLYLIHNPFSTSPIPRGYFKLPIEEYWLEDICYDQGGVIQEFNLHIKGTP